MTNVGGAEFNIIDAGDGASRLTALLGGEVDATSLPYSTAADYIENGQLKSLCTQLSDAPHLLPRQASRLRRPFLRWSWIPSMLSWLPRAPLLRS